MLATLRGTMHRQTLPALTVLATAALVATGCTSASDPSEEPTPTVTATATTAAPSPSPSPTASAAAPPTASPSPTDEVAAMEFTECEAAEYTVAHPADWDVNDADSLVDACRVFHPDTVDLPDQPQGIGLHWAVMVRIDEVPFEEVRNAEVQGELLTERDVTVAGRDAVVTEVRSDGVAMIPEGELTYGYTVDLDDRTLFVHTYSVGETDYERDKQVVDRMVEELELTLTADG